MAFEGLTEKLSSAFKKLRNKGRLSEADVKEAMREIRLALLEADVSYKVVKDFIKRVTEKAVGTEVLESLTPAQAIVKIVNQELIDLMGGDSTKITIASQPPTVVMMVGLQGAGKTTNAAKLAGLMRKQNGKRPLLVACDIYRPAAIQQLEVVGKQLDIPVFQMGQENPVTIAQAAIEHAKKHGNDMVFLDTAGRLHVDETLMAELQSIKEAVHPSEILLVVDAMIGQDAVNAAKAFDEALDIDGVVLTKLDGDARGGAGLGLDEHEVVRARHVHDELGGHALEMQVLGEHVDTLGQLAQTHVGDVARHRRLGAVEAAFLELLDQHALGAHVLVANDLADRVLSSVALLGHGSSVLPCSRLISAYVLYPYGASERDGTVRFNTHDSKHHKLTDLVLLAA